MYNVLLFSNLVSKVLPLFMPSGHVSTQKQIRAGLKKQVLLVPVRYTCHCSFAYCFECFVS